VTVEELIAALQALGPAVAIAPVIGDYTFSFSQADDGYSEDGDGLVTDVYYEHGQVHLVLED
jgi:hypothetical protein